MIGVHVMFSANMNAQVCEPPKLLAGVTRQLWVHHVNV
jgi:hypothetical protein